MNPPPEFAEEYFQLRERMDWAESALGRGQDVAQTKLLFTQFEEYYQKWRSLIEADPELRAGFDEALKGLEPLRRHLERIALFHLQEVIEARRDWCRSELIFQGVVATIGLRKEMPEHLKAEFEEVLRDRATGESFDSEKEFRDCEQRATEAQAKFRKALVEYEIDWPERVNVAVRERLEKLDGEGATVWNAEVAAELVKVAEPPKA